MMKIKKYGQFINENRVNMSIPLPQDIIDISNAYIKAGKDIFVVGGAIRDFLQGKNPKDYDLVTNALPEESKSILKGFNVSDEQGKNFGVLRVYTKNEPEGYEIASYRKDISGGRDTKGDDQKVEMGNHITIEDDCNRRDITINALFYNIKTEQIIDIVGGIDDIKNGVIRAVGDPSQRFLEDRLRILRVFRFASRMGAKIDINTSKAIKLDNRLRGVGLKDDVSQERIWDEFKKAFSQAKDFNTYLNYYTEYNMWEQVFPGSVINLDLIENDNLVIILSNLFKKESVDGLDRKLIQQYKIESNLVSKIVFLIRFLEFSPEMVTDFYKIKLQCGISDVTIEEWIKINNIRDKASNSFLKFIPSVSSIDLMSKGFKGKQLGDEIKRLEIENFKNTI